MPKENKPALTRWQMRKRDFRNRIVFLLNSRAFQKTVTVSGKIVTLAHQLAAIRTPWALVPAGVSLLSNISADFEVDNVPEEIEGLFPERFEKMQKECGEDTPLYTSMQLGVLERVGLLKFCKLELATPNKSFLTYQDTGFFVLKAGPKVQKGEDPKTTLSGLSVDYFGPTKVLRNFFNTLFRNGYDHNASNEPGFDIPLHQENIDFANRLVQDMGAERSPTFLLYGPPGTGKTKFVLAMASFVGRPCYRLENTRTILPLGMTMESLPACSILLLDEHRAATTTMHHWLDSMRKNRPDCALFACTNTPRMLGAALLRPERGGHLMPFPAPQKDEFVPIMMRNDIPQRIAEVLAPLLPEGLTHDYLQKAGRYCMEIMEDECRAFAVRVINQNPNISTQEAIQMSQNDRPEVLEKAARRAANYIIQTWGLATSAVSAEELVRMMAGQPASPEAEHEDKIVADLFKNFARDNEVDL